MVESKMQRQYSSQLPNRIMKIVELIPEGTMVEPGEVLIRFEREEIEAEILKTRTLLRESRYELASLTQQQELDEILLQETKMELNEQIRLAQQKLEKFTSTDGPAELKKLEHQWALAKRKQSRMEAEIPDLELLLGKGYITQTELELHREQMLAAGFDAQEKERLFQEYRDFGLAEAIQGQKNALDNLKIKHYQLEEKGIQGESLFKRRKEQTNDEIATLEKKEQDLMEYFLKCDVLAHFSGIVIYEKSYQQGAYIKPSLGMSFNNRQPILSVLNLEELLIQTRISEFLISYAIQGKTVSCEADAISDVRFEGEIEHIGLLAKKENHEIEKAFDLQIYLKSPPALLRPGMTVRCEMALDDCGNTWEIQQKHLIQEGAQAFCRILRQGETMELSVSICRQTETGHFLVSGDFQPSDILMQKQHD
jgi:multidrug resistance efflux pump